MLVSVTLSPADAILNRSQRILAACERTSASRANNHMRRLPSTKATCCSALSLGSPWLHEDASMKSCDSLDARMHLSP
jgi:hypothetical protein